MRQTPVDREDAAAKETCRRNERDGAHAVEPWIGIESRRLSRVPVFPVVASSTHEPLRWRRSCMTSNGRRDEIRDRLNRVFQEVFDDDAIQIFEAMTAKDIEEWDSLMHITLVVAIETEFALRLNAAEVGELENVGRMMDLLEERASR